MAQQDLEEKVCLVTGSTGGIGPAVTDHLVEAGGEVIGTYRSKGSLAEAKKRAKHSSRTSYLQADLTVPSELQSLRAKIEREHGSVSLLVNLVGGFSPGKFKDTSLEDINSSLDRHLATTFLTMKEFLDHLQENEGVAVNFSSQRALDSQPGALSYNLGKSAVTTLSKTAHREFDDIAVYALAPGTMDTPDNRKAMPDTGHSNWTDPGDIAKLVGFLATDPGQTIQNTVIRV